MAVGLDVRPPRTTPEPAPSQQEPSPPGGVLHWITRTRGGHGVLLGIASGIMAVLALEDFHVWPLIFVAFVPAIVAQHRIMPARFQALPLAIAIGMLFQGYLGPGLMTAARGGRLDWYMQIFGVWVVLLVYGLARRSRPFHVRTHYRWFILATPAAWVAIDAIRGFGADMLAGTWGMVGYALYTQPELIQPASVFGIHGVNFMILLINWTLAKLVLTWLDQTRGPVDGRRPLEWPSMRHNGIAVVAIIVLWLGWSQALLGSSDDTVRVAAVQPGAITLHEDWTYTIESPQEKLRRQIEQTRTAAAEGAELISWHEGGFEGDLLHTDIGNQFADLADELDIHLNIGWQARLPEGGGRYNEVAAFNPDGEFLGTNGKSHIGDFAGDAGDPERKHQYSVYDSGEGWAYGTIICFDLDFTNSARIVAHNGANVLAVSSNDLPGIEEKHSTHMVFRAIETGMGVFKADSNWDSVVVDPWGRILQYEVYEHGGQTTLVEDLPFRPLEAPQTFYVRFGEWFAWILAAFVLAMMGLSARNRILDRRLADLAGSEELTFARTD